jgi:hypothetical protein
MMNLTVTKYDAPLPPIRYKSTLGWSMELPEGWSKMPDASERPLASLRPELFCCDSDWSLGITWTRIRVPSYQAAEQFKSLIEMNGPIPTNDCDAVLASLIPLVGATTKAEALGVASGQRAMEVIKFCTDNKSLPPRFGIDLLVNVENGYIDRLAFYANADIFQMLLPMIKETLRSFRIEPTRAK